MAVALVVAFAVVGWLVSRRPAPEVVTVEVPAPPPKVVTGHLRVDTAPAGAAVMVDDDRVGVTPFDGQVPVGEHDLTVSLTGYQTVTEHVTVAEGTEVARTVQLEVAPATLRLASDPTGARVSLDGAGVGETPVELSEVAPGTHQIVVEAKGYYPYESRIDLAPGQQVDLHPLLKKDRRVMFRGVLMDPEERDAILTREKREITSLVKEGTTHFAKGQYDLCIAKMEEVLRLDANNPDAKRYKKMAEDKKAEIRKSWGEAIEGQDAILKSKKRPAE